MKFIPNSEIKQELLKNIDISDINELFSDIPKSLFLEELDLADGLSQMQTEEKLRKISKRNKSCHDLLSFLGGGIKPHYVPVAVKALTSRSEFFTAYTPYQSEASQGFLQAMFEYQSMIAELTGMDVANCSLYDGVTALSEAALMCMRIKRKNKFIMPHNISWEKKSVLKNYGKGPGIEIIEVDYDLKKGTVDLEDLEDSIDENTAGVYIENPNFFGVFEEDIEKISKIVKDAGSLLVVGVDPISLGIIKSPGEYGADIVIGEGRALGNSMDFGGSSLGLFSCKKDYLRQMPGRIIGLTKDSEGKRAFTMTLQTREQHIRRGRATSNICTNEGLCALNACVYISLIGANGFTNLSKKNFENAQILEEEITKLKGYEKVFSGSHFNEFVIRYPDKVDKINKKLLIKNILGGISLEKDYPELENCALFGITEINSKKDVGRLITSLKEVSNV
jgi:glycine dehydrogenase subunit 1